MVTLKQLRNFLVLAQELHFAKAAQKLGITQAALSSEIKKLENILGFDLFDRSNKWQIGLTAAGENYLNGVRNIPDMLENSRQGSMEIARGKAGILSIAVCNFVYSRFDLGKVCKKMQQLYPKVKLRICDLQRSPQAIERIRTGQVDIGFFMVSDLKRQTEGLVYKKVLNIDLMVAISKSDSLAAKTELQIEDLKNKHFILPSREEIPLIRQYMDSLFMEKFGHQPFVTLEATGFHGVIQLISAGLGVGFLPQLFLDTLPADIVLKKSPFPLQRTLVAAWDENNHSPAVSNFIKLLDSAE